MNKNRNPGLKGNVNTPTEERSKKKSFQRFVFTLIWRQLGYPVFQGYIRLI